jgi:hypothetical protein
VADLTTEEGIRRLIATWADAIRAGDIDGAPAITTVVTAPRTA